MPTVTELRWKESWASWWERKETLRWKAIAKLYSQADADAVTIQYGGSMNDGNADELLSKTNVDGGLIGGASLVAEKFAAIVKAASK